MNAPIQAIYQTGQNLYAVLVSPVDGTVYNTVSLTWEVYNPGHWPQYAVALTEYTGSGYYRAAYPIASPTVLSSEVIYLRAGGSPVLGDTPATAIGQSQGANVAAAGNSWVAGQNFAESVGSQQQGSISGSPISPTTWLTSLVNTQVGAYAGRAIIMTSGILIQQAAFILNYDGAGVLTINGFPSGGTPANSDTFIIV